MAKISVIVPVFRAEAFLKKCTDSILSQSYHDLELILIDDGSPDESGALCDAIAREDERVVVIHKENGGVSSARNAGLAKATGMYIAFVDSDDWLEPTALEQLLRCLEGNGADIAGCGHYNVSPDGVKEEEAPVMPVGVYNIDKIGSGIVAKLLGERLAFPVLNGFIWRFLYLRSIIVENDITFEGAYLEDELFLLEYFCHARRFAVVDQPLYNYFWNTNSATHKYMPNYMEIFEGFMKRKEALVHRYGLERQSPRWKENSNWAGLLIAVANEYAPGNPATWREKQRNVISYTQRPEMRQAIAIVKPTGLARNKQIVANMICLKQFTLLTALYRFKNRKK